MIFNFLLLEAPLSCSKRFKKSPASVKRKIRFITPAKMSFPGQKEPSPASATARRSCLTAEAEFPGKCPTARIATVVLNLIPGQ